VHERRGASVIRRFVPANRVGSDPCSATPSRVAGSPPGLASTQKVGYHRLQLSSLKARTGDANMEDAALPHGREKIATKGLLANPVLVLAKG
jgi:hypothetical protein